MVGALPAQVIILICFYAHVSACRRSSVFHRSLLPLRSWTPSRRSSHYLLLLPVMHLLLLCSPPRGAYESEWQHTAFPSHLDCEKRGPCSRPRVSRTASGSPFPRGPRLSGMQHVGDATSARSLRITTSAYACGPRPVRCRCTSYCGSQGKSYNGAASFATSDICESTALAWKRLVQGAWALNAAR